MLTRAQMRTFQDLKDGKLTAKQKADFYYRMSRILRNNLESIKAMAILLDEIPDSYQEKIDFCSAANDSLILLEKLVKRVIPYPDAGCINGTFVNRIFEVEVDNPLPNILLDEKEKAIASIMLSYEPMESEVNLPKNLYNFRNFIDEGSSFLTNHKVYTAEEFDKVLAKWNKKPKFEARLAHAPAIANKPVSRVHIASKSDQDSQEGTAPELPDPDSDS